MDKDLLQSDKEKAHAFAKGLDSSFKLKYNVSFNRVLDLIDNNEIKDSKELKNKLDLIYNRVILSLRRSKNGKVREKWLSDSSSDIYDTFFTYFSFDRNFYSVDKEAIEYFLKQDSFTGLDNIYDIDFVMEHNNEIYLVEVKTEDQKISLYIATSLFSNTKDKKHVGYRFNAELTVDNENRLNVKITPFHISCSNKDCPRYKQCFSKEMIHNGVVFKETNCDDIKSCDFVSEAGKLPLSVCVESATRLMGYMCNRVYPKYNKETKEYEHIPMPENTGNVKIYLRREQDDDDKTNSNENKSKIVGSHASPREHKRRGGTRRGYYRKNGTYVRPTTFKATTVNKGHTKCTYEIKG